MDKNSWNIIEKLEPMFTGEELKRKMEVLPVYDKAIRNENQAVRLMELGFHWARQKQMWYLHFDDFHKYSSKPTSLSFIRDKYGSVVIKTEGKDEKDRRLQQC